MSFLFQVHSFFSAIFALNIREPKKCVTATLTVTKQVKGLEHKDYEGAGEKEAQDKPSCYPQDGMKDAAAWWVLVSFPR